MTKIVNNLLNIAEQNKENLNCLVDIYNLAKLARDDPQFYTEYQNIMEKYSFDSKKKINIGQLIKNIIDKDANAFQKFSKMLFEKESSEAILSFYIPYLMWNIVEVTESQKVLKKKRV